MCVQRGECTCVLFDMSQFYYQSNSTFCICFLCSFVAHKAWQLILFCLSHLSQPQLIKHSNLLIDEWILSFSCTFWPCFFVIRLVKDFENHSNMRVGAIGQRCYIHGLNTGLLHCHSELSGVDWIKGEDWAPPT